LGKTSTAYAYKVVLTPNLTGTNKYQQIYSPALYMLQIHFVKALQSISMNPNPQIDSCDIMSVNVNQAVEASKASIILNNRGDNDCVANAFGKYTYIPGSNNFTGIKPIQIKMGYNREMYTVFTGYVTNREYSRSSPTQSTVALQCEDRALRLRDQWCINLPFFDGWCIGPDSQILTSRGLERIDNLYKRGGTFEKIGRAHV
jgi:hypothetical protein